MNWLAAHPLVLLAWAALWVLVVIPAVVILGGRHEAKVASLREDEARELVLRIGPGAYGGWDSKPRI